MNSLATILGSSSSRRPRLFALVIGLSVVPMTPAQVTEVTLDATADNTIYQDNTDHSNGEGEYLFAGRIKSGLRRRALLRFDDLSSIPASAAIASVRLDIYLSRVNDTAGALNLFLHRVESAWGESTSNAGAPGGLGVMASQGDATWTQRFFPDLDWHEPGGDFSAQFSSQTLVSGVGLYSWPDSPMMRADLTSWIADSETNHGWIVLDNLLAPLGHARRFNSRENSDVSTRPKLVVSYEFPMFLDSFEQ